MQTWLVRKNCSLTPAQTMGASFAASTVVMSIGLLFAVVGHWLVLLFAVAEVALLWSLVLRYCRHAADHERLSLAHNVLTVEITECGATTRRDIIASLVRFDGDTDERGIVLRYGGETLRIGRHLANPARRRLLDDLRSSCRRSGTRADPMEDGTVTPAPTVVANDVVALDPPDR